MRTKKAYYNFFWPIFYKIQWFPNFFWKTFSLFFLENYQPLYMGLLAQSLPIVEFHRWLKYLHNFQSHPIYMCS
jgi:hypothetical protein